MGLGGGTLASDPKLRVVPLRGQPDGLTWEVLAIEEGGRRIRLSREKALAHEEQAETQAYMKDAAKKGGFGLTLGDVLNQARQKP